MPDTTSLFFVKKDQVALTMTFAGLDMSDYDSITMIGRRRDQSRFSIAGTPVKGEAEECSFVFVDELNCAAPQSIDVEFEFVLTSDGSTFRLPQVAPVALNLRDSIGTP